MAAQEVRTCVVCDLRFSDADDPAEVAAGEAHRECLSPASRRWRRTDWGWMLSTSFAGRDLEMAHFERPGSEHVHGRWEHALCLRGCGFVEVGTDGVPAGAGRVVIVPPETPHRMVPTTVGEREEPYSWLIWYADGPMSDPTFVPPPLPMMAY